MNSRGVIFLILFAVIFTAASCNRSAPPAEPVGDTMPAARTYDFSQSNGRYLFRGQISSGWMVEYVPATEAVNIYDPAGAGESALEKSQIIIRFFEASGFLTLASVDILSREETELRGHAAVRYEIRKKPGVPDFAGQPPWRSRQHKLIDVRYSQNSPSVFYVIAGSPALPASEFEKFLQSLVFEND